MTLPATCCRCRCTELSRPDADVNLHVYTAGCPEIDRCLSFRNHLRRNESDRELYARTKRELAKRTCKYGQNYADAKRAVIDEVIQRAGAGP